MKLYNHQVEVLNKTKDKNRVAYYLDMGLGKTYVGSEKMKELGATVNLVVCQKSKIHDWTNHLMEHYPEYEVLIITKNIPDLDANKKVILVINYDLVWRRVDLLKLKDFTLMLDESSLIKNLKSNRTKFILKLNASNVILLSGTPVAGKYEELYSQVKLLGWSITKTQFFKNFIITKKIDICGFKVEKVIGYKNVDRLKRKLREHGAEFMKTEEVFDLPETEFITMYVDSTSAYRKFKKDSLITIEDHELVGDTVLNQLLYSRQLASQYNKNKLDAIKELLESTEDRVIIFYNFKEELEKLKSICTKLQKPVSEVNGNVSDLKNYESKNNCVTLIQYQAGAMGLNLQLANKIIYFSLPLQSELFEQSKKRTHRIGQTRTCFYYYLITKNSIDEKILKTLDQRKDFTNELFK